MPHIERTAHVQLGGERRPRGRVARRGERRVRAASVLAAVPHRRSRRKDESRGAARRGARRLHHDVSRGRADESRHAARSSRDDRDDPHGRGRGPGTPDRRLGRRVRRSGRRRRRRCAAGGGARGGRELSVLGAPQARRRDGRRLPPACSRESPRPCGAPAHAQGVRAGAGTARDAARNPLRRALRADAPHDRAVALPRARPGRARRAEGGGGREGGREARPRADARRRNRRAHRRPRPRRGGRLRRRGRDRARASRRDRARARDVLAHAAGAPHARRAAPPSGSRRASASSGSSTSARPSASPRHANAGLWRPTSRSSSSARSAARRRRASDGGRGTRRARRRAPRRRSVRSSRPTSSSRACRRARGRTPAPGSSQRR